MIEAHHEESQERMTSFEAEGQPDFYNPDVNSSDYKARHERAARVAKALILAVAYSANVGGIGTLIGTPTNLILTQQTFPRCQAMSFLAWMKYAIPLAVLCEFLTWAILVWYFLGLNELKTLFSTSKSGVKDQIDEEIKNKFRDDLRMMGKMRYGAKVTTILFCSCALAWMTRSIGESKTGWGKIFPDGKDSTAAIAISVILMTYPQKPNFINWFRNRLRDGMWTQRPLPKPAPPLLTWKRVQHGLAWDVIMLLGGGFALASMIKVSGLALVIGEGIGNYVSNMSDSMTILLATAGISITTGFSSNVSTAVVFLPILGSLAKDRGMPVDELLVPATIACSFAFILPISTPPNAIAFSTGKIVTTDMLKAGGLLNALLVIITWAWTKYTGILIFSFGEYDTIADSQTGDLLSATNSTTLPP